jgi:hypothetical protein
MPSMARTTPPSFALVAGEMDRSTTRPSAQVQIGRGLFRTAHGQSRHVVDPHASTAQPFGDPCYKASTQGRR